MLCKGLLQYVIIQLRIANFINSIPYEYNSSSGKIRLTPVKWRQILYNFVTALEVGYNISLILYFATPSVWTRMTLQSQIMAFGFLNVMIASSTFKTSFRLLGNTEIPFLNSLVDFEAKHCGNLKKNQNSVLSPLSRKN
jgi:hypothetical protein